ALCRMPSISPWSNLAPTRPATIEMGNNTYKPTNWCQSGRRPEFSPAFARASFNTIMARAWAEPSNCQKNQGRNERAHLQFEFREGASHCSDQDKRENGHCSGNNCQAQTEHMNRAVGR